MTLTLFSDAALIASFRDLVVGEQEKLALQLEHLVELDRRKLFLHHSSLKAYLVEEYQMEEWLAERRIRAARLMNRLPFVKTKIESGLLNLTLLEIAQGCAYREKLKDPELSEILESISGMSCQAARRELAGRYPETMEVPKDRIRPLTADLSEVRFVASEELLEKLDEIRGLLAHVYPERLTLATLINHLATDYRQRHHPEEKARRAQERKAKAAQGQEAEDEQPTETIDSPAATRVEEDEDHRTPRAAQVHSVTLRDGYRCRYEDPVTGKRCTSSFRLDMDHVQEWAFGGKTVPENLRYLCKSHHRRVTFLQFGDVVRYTINVK